VKGLRNDLQTAFAGQLSHEPFEDLPASEIPANARWCAKGAAGGGVIIYLAGKNVDLADVLKKLRDECKGFLEKDEAMGTVLLGIGDDLDTPTAMAGAPENLTKIKVLASTVDIPDARSTKIRKIREAAKKLGDKGDKDGIPLSADPFTGEGNIGPSVASELKESSIIAMIISWVLMIVYVGFRFASWRFGVAAVIALIHDATIAIGFMTLGGAIIPKAWGLTFEMNMTFVAAILTVIGYSINDTIIIYDRIRENLAMMKKETFSEIINASTNQMLGRTILTSFTVFITCVILYFFTMTSAGGVAEFAFPMLIGVIVGTYSSIYVASAIVLWWYKGAKPQLSS
jgi:preprotein translocase SecF subunit